MSKIEDKIVIQVQKAITELFGQEIDSSSIALQNTRKDIEGDFTLVVFSFVKLTKKSPEETAQLIGEYLKKHMKEIDSFQVLKGFLNFTLHHQYWMTFLQKASEENNYGTTLPDESEPVVVEYSSPNTNKPLHLGHIRNNLLGYSLAQILEASGKKTYKVNLVNDRGIHICKSMLAWMKWGNGETPESSKKKGDKLVGDYYVLFETALRKEAQALKETHNYDDENARNNAPLMQEARELLRKWEARDPDVFKIWKTMNGWVYRGFDSTYQRLGVSFDKIYYESDTYLMGKKIVLDGLEKSAFFKKEDGSVWADLTNEGLDEKLLLRADGTSVYITQDIGTAQLRFDDYNPGKMIYVVGNEQNYHFEVLKKALKKLEKPYTDHLHHLSYGMVELPQGKMKSREGTVVDADDLMDEMYKTARKTTEELGKIEGFSEEEKENLFHIIGMGALKYFILKVDPKKNMLFNPEESIDFNGNTGPFIQYTHARIRSIIRKAEEKGIADKNFDPLKVVINIKEKNLIRSLYNFPQIVQDAAADMSPALIANYVYELAKEFNQFYHDYSVLNEPDENISLFRLKLSGLTSKVIKTAMDMLGIEVPERM
ncbi:MAG: arginine--tRNA ligase [Bacteroidetes bacterium]|nr:MAG: arginine--tRNA ligase [Bacteroidota bacterium]